MNKIDSKRPHVGDASVSLDRTPTELQQLRRWPRSCWRLPASCLRARYVATFLRRSGNSVYESLG
jgi:hypothetical protein